jgi:hypothetical protein
MEANMIYEHKCYACGKVTSGNSLVLADGCLSCGYQATPKAPSSKAKNPIVGIAGYARSGKDTAAQVLIERGWKRMAFADQLKMDVERCIGYPIAAMTADQKEFWRPLLVEYARLRRAQHPDYWIWQVESNMKMNVGPGEKVVITDVRYANEAKWILSRGGLMIFVERIGVKPANSEECDSIHAMWIDPTISNPMKLALNNDTVDVLHADIYGIVQDHFGKV